MSNEILIERLRGRADYCEMRGEETTPELLRASAAALAQLIAERIGILALLYQVAPVTVARMCDENLDRSGELLGRVREMSNNVGLEKTT